jgi:putative YhbY family RNA-binding protein
MTRLQLPHDARLRLKAQAHHLKPVVLLGAQGLTEAVFREIDRALTAHGLIKIRVPGDDRAAREEIFAAAAERLGAAQVGAIGKLLILFRPKPDDAARPQNIRPRAKPPAPPKRRARAKRS